MDSSPHSVRLRALRIWLPVLAALCLVASIAVIAPASGSPATESTYCLGRRATLVGTQGDDNLVGTDGSDVIVGLGGNDIIDGLDGDDSICGGSGNDTLSGGPGADRIDAGDDDDVVIGGLGDDRVWGRDGDDTLGGGPGTDVLRGNSGADDLSGGVDSDPADQQDRLVGGPDTDQCEGEEVVAYHSCETTGKIVGTPSTTTTPPTTTTTPSTTTTSTTTAPSTTTTPASTTTTSTTTAPPTTTTSTTTTSTTTTSTLPQPTGSGGVKLIATGNVAPYIDNVASGNITELDNRAAAAGIRGMAFQARDGQLSISAALNGGTLISYDRMLRSLSGIQPGDFQQLTDNFVYAYASDRDRNWPNYGNTAAWNTRVENWRRFARAANEVGWLTGIRLDTEDYTNTNRNGIYSLNRGTANQAFALGDRIASAVIEEWPDVVIFSSHGPHISESANFDHMNQVCGRNKTEFAVNDISRSSPNADDWMHGWIAAMDGTSASFIDGGELYMLRDSEHFECIKDFQLNTYPSQSFVRPSVRAAYPDHVSYSFGIYDCTFGFAGADGPAPYAMNPAIWEQTIENAGQHADEYVWLQMRGGRDGNVCSGNWWQLRNINLSGGRGQLPPTSNAWISATRRASEFLDSLG